MRNKKYKQYKKIRIRVKLKVQYFLMRIHPYFTIFPLPPLIPIRTDQSNIFRFKSSLFRANIAQYTGKQGQERQKKR